MPSILGFVMKEVLRTDGSHPALDKTQCLNSKQRKASCSACIESCPGGVIFLPQAEQMTWRKCLNCGICAAVCPARAFDPVQYQREQLVRMLHDGRAEHMIGCARVEGKLDSKAWCLASFSWEMLVMLALVGRVKIRHGDCEACDRRGKLSCFAQAMDKARAFLGETRFADRIITTGGDAQYCMSRRELFGRLLPGRIRETAPEQDSSLNLRSLLIETIERTAGKEDFFTWDAPELTQKCWACGICARVCPTDAIRMQKQEETWRVVCLPVLCTGCTVCKEVCVDNAIAAVRPIRLRADEIRLDHHTNAVSCSACGAAIKPDSGETLCMRCRAIQKSGRK